MAMRAIMDLIKKYQIDKSTRTHKGFHGVLHTFFPVGQSGVAMKSFFGDACKITLFFVTNHYADWFWNDNDLDRLRSKFFARVKKDPKYFDKSKKDWASKQKDFDKIISQVHEADFSILSNEELSELYDLFYEKYIQEFSHFMALGDGISMRADSYLVPEFKKVLGKDFNEVFPKLMNTSYRSFVEEEESARQKMYEYVEKAKKIPHKLLAEHSKKFFFVQNNYAKAGYLTPAEFEKIIRADWKKQHNLPRVEAQDGVKQDWAKRYKFSQWQKTLLSIVNDFFAIQDTRKKYVLISNFYQFKFLQEAARRTQISFEALRYSIYPEYRKILAGGITEQSLLSRKKRCAVIHTQQGFQVLAGQEAERMFKHLNKQQTSSDTVAGLIASPGRITGRVKIILKLHDMANMDKGDILVASMTRPEMTPAIKLASAVVTDEGGVTCHAAIISRELGIPCIIGTKTATKVFKDGDLVEVDANKGIVKKISK
jgi:phosphohistidine swiveling domain-containing protein